MSRLLNLGVDCRVYDPLIDQNSNPALCSFEEVMQSDVLSLHVPLTFDGPYATHQLLDKEKLVSLKPDCLLLNTGRGPVIDNKALSQVLIDRTDLQVVLDVWENEPDIAVDLMPRLSIATPHIAGYSLEGKWRGAQAVCEAMSRYFQLEQNLEQSLEPSNEALFSKISPVTFPAMFSELMFSEIGRPERSLNAASLDKVVMGCYPIEEDDARLRAVCDSSEATASGFDRLRKEYPVRRELASYQIHNAGSCSLERQQQLIAAGFDAAQFKNDG